MNDAINIVVIGGGFAGVTLLRRLQSALPKSYRMVLISEESYTTFNPLLPESVGASIFPEQVVAPIRQMVDAAAGTRFIMGQVTAVDHAAQRVHCSSLAGALEIPYGHLVLAFGNRARLDFLPGLAEHALPLKTIGDAMEIRNQVLRRVAQIELEDEAATRRALGAFLVIGGGFSGVEVAGELVDCLAGLQRYYPRVKAGELTVTLIHDQDRLLPELPAELGAAARRSLEQRGVSVRLGGARVNAVEAGGVRLADGSFVDGATVICTVGTRPNGLAEALGVPLDRGRVRVAPDLSVPGFAGLWALGDCALVPNGQDDGKPAPPTAQFAVREAQHLARNLLAAIRGGATVPFGHRSLGMMAGVGHMNGVALVFGIRLTGLPAWLLWRAYYLSQMPTTGRKLRIFVEWTWGMFFPTDITHLRFTRSRDSEAKT